MADVVNKTTVQYLKSVSTPDFPTASWIINPDLSALTAVLQKYWKISGDSVLEMTQTEKDAVDAADSSARQDLIEADMLVKLHPDFFETTSVTASDSGLVITVNITDLISNDQTTVIADSTDVKFILMGLCHNTTTDVFFICAFEKTTGIYDDLATDEELITYLKEYSCVANGTALTEIKTWLT